MEPYFPSAIVFFVLAPAQRNMVTVQPEMLRNMRKYEQNPFIISYFYANIG